MASPKATSDLQRKRRWAVAAGVAVVAVVTFLNVGHAPVAPPVKEAPFIAPAPPVPPPVAPAPPAAAPPAPPVAVEVPQSTEPADSPVATDADRAASMSDADDEAALAARKRVLIAAVKALMEQQRGELIAVLEAANAGDDNRTLEAARSALRSFDWSGHFAGWQRLRPAARRLNDEAKVLADLDPEQARKALARALAMDPYDKEVAGNLGMYMTRAGDPHGGFAMAVYALSLPREAATDTGRSADWHLLGSSLARMGEVGASAAAYYVALAITTNLSGLCSSLLAQQAAYGDDLKPPVDLLFRRIQSRNQQDVAGCAYPPQWRR